MFSDGFVAECHVELFERQVSGPARLHVHGGGPADAAAVGRVAIREGGRSEGRGWGRMLEREEQERTNLLLRSFCLFPLGLIFLPVAEAGVLALRFRLQPLGAAGAPEGAAGRNGGAGVPAVARVGEVGGAAHGWS